MWFPKQDLVERIHGHLLARMGGETGPLNPNSLDAAITRPKMKIYGTEPFKGTVAKTAALGYSVISWHPFLDGNKRTAVWTMQAMLKANGIEIVLPPYIVKYTVQAALPPENKRHIDEAEFTRKITALSYPKSSSFSRGWKEFRYELCPRALFESYQMLLRRFPGSHSLRDQFFRRVFDWFAASDAETMAKTLTEWQLRQEQGFPKDIPPLEIHIEDFDEINPPEEPSPTLPT